MSQGTLPRRPCERRGRRSSRVDPPEPVPESGRGAGGQHGEKPRVLVVAVERDPLQRGQMIGALGKQHARPRRHRGLEAARARQREFAGAGRDPVAIGIGEVEAGTLQGVFDPGTAGGDLVGRRFLGLLGEIAMRDGMRTDRDQRLVGEWLQFIPGHAELAADGCFVDAMARAQRADFAGNVVFAGQ
jgi:hypothetical protein